MKPAVTTACPPPATLAAFASGRLDEATAETVVRHLDECLHCQRTVDQLAPQGDSLVAALRRPAAMPDDENQLAALIAAAGQQTHQPAAAPTRLSPEARPVSLEEFVTRLRDSRLLAESEIDVLQAQSQPSDARQFARSLVKLGKLTRFQSQAILQGRDEHLVVGNYEVLQQLGEGGMGRVFKARHRQLGRIVCLKVLHAAGRRSPDLVERFRREAKTVAALSHPHIVVAHDAAEADGVPYLAMEYIEGQDLARHVQQHGPLRAAAAARIILQAAEAMSYAHSQGVIHRDIKPSNLLLASGGRPAADSASPNEGGDSSNCFIKVLDLGLARFDSLLSESPDALSHTSMTSTGVVVGTVDYMSPEQALNSRKADHRSDIYSLGCTLFFLLTGRVMHDGETVMEKLVAHRERPAPSLIGACAAASAALEAIFGRMVAKRPLERYQSMSEVAQDMQLLLAGKSPRAMGLFSAPVIVEPPPLARARAARWNPALVTMIAIAAAVILLLGGGWIAASIDWRDSPGSPPALGGAAFDASPPAAVVGHADTLFNGGGGRALVVVPHAGFYDDQFTGVRDALDRHGIQWQVASSRAAQPAHPKMKTMAPLPVDMTLDLYDADDFDAVIFVGGYTGEFTHKGGESGKQAKQLIDQTVKKRRAVASIGNGWDVLHDTGLCKECELVNIGGLTKYIPQDQREGIVFTAPQSKYAANLVQVMFDELRSPGR